MLPQRGAAFAGRHDNRSLACAAYVRSRLATGAYNSGRQRSSTTTVKTA